MNTTSEISTCPCVSNEGTAATAPGGAGRGSCLRISCLFTIFFGKHPDDPLRETKKTAGFNVNTTPKNSTRAYARNEEAAATAHEAFYQSILRNPEGPQRGKSEMPGFNMDAASENLTRPLLSQKETVATGPGCAGRRPCLLLSCLFIIFFGKYLEGLLCVKQTMAGFDVNAIFTNSTRP